MEKKTNPYASHRHPTEIISHTVWFYFHFTSIFRDIEEIFDYRGVIVTYEAIRQWTIKFGQDYANTLCRQQPPRGDIWHLDEMVLTIKGQHHYLWRAVDQSGYTLDIQTQSECSQTFLPQSFKTDGLCSPCYHYR